MDFTPNLVTCDWCKCQVGKDKIEKHKTSKCPEAPAEIIAARPKQKRHSSDPILFNRGRVKIQGGMLVFDYPESPDPDRLPTTPSPQDRQINSEARVTKSGNGVFYVHNVLSSGGTWHHPLQADCQYCHRTIEVNANGPCNMPQFAKGEACRLALLEHLRTDDARPYHSPTH